MSSTNVFEMGRTVIDAPVLLPVDTMTLHHQSPPRDLEVCQVLPGVGDKRSTAKLFVM